jgi:hypothetical protein
LGPPAPENAAAPQSRAAITPGTAFPAPPIRPAAGPRAMLQRIDPN